MKMLHLFALIFITIALNGCGAVPASSQSENPTATVLLATPTAAAAPATPTSPATATLTPAPPPSPTPPPVDTPTPAPTDTPPPPVTDTPSVSAELIAQGIQVYQAQYCGICHKLDSANTQGIFGPDHDNMGSVARQRLQDPRYHGSATTAADYIRESIIAPEAFVVEGYAQSRHKMPAYVHLSDDELTALVQMLLQQ